MARSTYVEALLGKQLFQRVKETPILVVGAGGIGCELLKNLVLVGFANIEIIDLDTIDLSNLNRQFLFRKPDIKKSKALVAAASARHFNPSSGIRIHARHGNVKDAQNDVDWIRGFGLVMNALDNMDARKHVNRLCQAAGVPLIESGTSGYLGQATPIIPNVTECFECVPRDPPKSFPVCTIRNTPSEPIHCIVWAKSFLFGKLFGEDDEATEKEELDQAQANGENVSEIEELRRESQAFREVRQNIGEAEGPQKVFGKIFNTDINRLLQIEDMWKAPGRVKPKPLELEGILDGTFTPPPLRAAPSATAAPAVEPNGSSSSAAASNSQTNGETPADSRLLKDQRELTLKDNLDLFLDSCRRLSARAIAHPNILLSFDKDDDDTLDFVLATANLRATAYGIPTKTRFQVKEMAGNIIPAIATTNAIIAGFIVMEAIKLLGGQSSHPAKSYIRNDPMKPLGRVEQQKPFETCQICRDTYITLKADPERCTLGDIVNLVLGTWLQPVLRSAGQSNGDGDAANGNDDEDEVVFGVYEGGRLLADPDFDDNLGRTLANLGIERGKFITAIDEDERYRPIHIALSAPEPNTADAFTLPSALPTVAARPAKAERAPSPPSDFEVLDIMPTTAQSASTERSSKRGAPDDADVSLGEEGHKRQKVGEDKPIVIDGAGGDDDDDDFFEIVE